MSYRGCRGRRQGFLKVPFKELVCHNQGFQSSTKIAVTGSDRIIDSGVVCVHRWRQDM